MWRGERGRDGGRLLGEMERERGQKVGGWRRIMNSLLTNALPEVVVGGINMDLKKRKMEKWKQGRQGSKKIGPQRDRRIGTENQQSVDRSKDGPELAAGKGSEKVK